MSCRVIEREADQTNSCMVIRQTLRMVFGGRKNAQTDDGSVKALFASKVTCTRLTPWRPAHMGGAVLAAEAAAACLAACSFATAPAAHATRYALTAGMRYVGMSSLQCSCGEVCPDMLNIAQSYMAL